MIRKLIFLAIPLLALRWPWPIAIGSLRGEGAIDPTVMAYLFPFVAMVIGMPGWFVIVLREPGASKSSGSVRVWLRGSLLLVTLSSLLIILWSSVAIVRIGTTLSLVDSLWLVAPMAAWYVSVRLRNRFDKA